MYHTQESTRSFEQTMEAFNPAGVMGDWRERTLCMLRAQERMMQGMAAAARLELRFGQECWASRLGLLTGSWTEPGHASQQLADEMDRFITVLREMNDEMKACYAEAGKLLTSAAEPINAHKSAGAVKRTKDAVEDAVEDAGEEASQTAS
jgi:hypothetical protein